MNRVSSNIWGRIRYLRLFTVDILSLTFRVPIEMEWRCLYDLRAWSDKGNHVVCRNHASSKKRESFPRRRATKRSNEELLMFFKDPALIAEASLYCTSSSIADAFGGNHEDVSTDPSCYIVSPGSNQASGGTCFYYGGRC